MASLSLYVGWRIGNITAEHMVLMGSTYELTFIDNSPLWPDEPHTYFNIATPDAEHFVTLTEETVIASILSDVQNCVAFSWDGIDFQRTRIGYNQDEQRFVNEVGSREHRPDTVTATQNLFLAGDYCRHLIDVVTIESVVVDGYLAAPAVVDRTGVGAPINILEPQKYSVAKTLALKIMLTPHVHWVESWSMFNTGQSAIIKPDLRRYALS